MKINTYSFIEKKIYPTILLIIFALSGSGQSIDLGQFNIGLVYPLSSQGSEAATDTNVFSFNLIGGISSVEKGFTYAGIANVVRNEASGFQYAGISNHIGKRSEGALFAGIVNTYGGGKGFQGAGIGNIARGNVEGAQFAGIVNKAADLTGSQFSGFSNVAQAVIGFQFAGFINTSKEIKGSQFAGFTNITGNASNGSQFAGFLNKAGNIHGSQFAGFINVAKKVKGAQFAGFINIADSSDHPIGLINIIKKGEKTIGVSTDETLTTLLSFRSGGKVMYGILGAGYNFKNEDEVYAFEAGFGTHFFQGNHFRMSAEIATVMLESFKAGEYFKSSFRLLPSVKLSKQIELYGGPVFNYVNTNTAEGKALSEHYISNWTNSRNKLEGIYIGYMGGLHFIF